MLVCSECRRPTRQAPVFQVRCGCGGLLLWESESPPAPRSRHTPVWRDPHIDSCFWKREDLNPTGSFKDRGAEFLLQVAVSAGARRLVLDSSGSAALAGVRAANRGGIPIDVHAPGTMAARRLETLKRMGAVVHARGTRSQAAARAGAEARNAFWFTHVYHPGFAFGVSGMVEEIEKMGDSVPRTWFVPVGNGSLILGLAIGLARLDRVVRLIAVQAENCPGLRSPGGSGTSRAGGLAVCDPPRREFVLAALSDPDEDIVHVSESAIRAAEVDFARNGILADPASAAVRAAIQQLAIREPVLGILSGAGSR